MPAIIAVVVVLPFVADTRTDPSGSRAARRSTALGSTASRSLPGRVVPPPRPANRERAPTVRAAVTSSSSSIVLRVAVAAAPPTRAYLRFAQHAIPLLV